MSIGPGQWQYPILPQFIQEDMPFTGNETSTEEFIVAFTEYQTSMQHKAYFLGSLAFLCGIGVGVLGVITVCGSAALFTKPPVEVSVPVSSVGSASASILRHISAGCVACEN